MWICGGACFWLLAGDSLGKRSTKVLRFLLLGYIGAVCRIGFRLGVP